MFSERPSQTIIVDVIVQLVEKICPICLYFPAPPPKEAGRRPGEAARIGDLHVSLKSFELHLDDKEQAWQGQC